MKDQNNKKIIPPLPENGETSLFNRILKVPIKGIAEEGERFSLENGYYINEAETILLRSNEKTGKYFRLEKNSAVSVQGNGDEKTVSGPDGKA